MIHEHIEFIQAETIETIAVNMLPYYHFLMFYAHFETLLDVWLDSFVTAVWRLSFQLRRWWPVPVVKQVRLNSVIGGGARNLYAETFCTIFSTQC